MIEERFEYDSGLSLIVVAMESELPGYLPENYIKLVTGVGKINAAMTLMRALLLGSYDCVINFGSAGGISEHREKLLPIHKVVQRDMDCTPLEVPKFVTPGENLSHIKTHNIRIVDDENICYSGDSFCVPSAEHPIVDMESYALAKVCRDVHIPFFCYKYISDSGSPDDWKNNHTRGSDLFREKVLFRGVWNNNE